MRDAQIGDARPRTPMVGKGELELAGRGNPGPAVARDLVARSDVPLWGCAYCAHVGWPVVRWLMSRQSAIGHCGDMWIAPDDGRSVEHNHVVVILDRGAQGADRFVRSQIETTASAVSTSPGLHGRQVAPVGVQEDAGRDRADPGRLAR